MNETTTSDSSTDDEHTRPPIPGTDDDRLADGYGWRSDDSWTFKATVNCDGFADVLEPAAALMDECRLAISPQGAAIRAVDAVNVAAVEVTNDCVATSTGTICAGVPVRELAREAPEFILDKGREYALRIEHEPGEGATLTLRNGAEVCEVAAYDPEPIREAPAEWPGPDQYDVTVIHEAPRIRGVIGATAEASRSEQIRLSTTAESVHVAAVEWSNREASADYHWGIAANCLPPGVEQLYAADYVVDLVDGCWADGEATLRFGDEQPLELTVGDCRVMVAPRIMPDDYEDEAPDVRTDGGQPPLRRCTGTCDCGRGVTTAVRRSATAMAADPTARARCRGCGSTVVTRGDPPREGRAIADGGTAQTDLGRDPTTREVARPDQDEDNRPVCPDCGQYVGASKGGGKPLPNTEATAFGWECPDCELTLPSNCSGRAAPMFNDHMAGLEVLFRDGTPRWVPVPERFVDDEDDDSDPVTDGGLDVGAMPFDYGDLEYEAAAVVARAGSRIDEKESEHAHAAWRDDDPLHHAELAEDHFLPFKNALVNGGDLATARTEAADIVNHLLMALVNVPADEQAPPAGGERA